MWKVGKKQLTQEGFTEKSTKENPVDLTGKPSILQTAEQRVKKLFTQTTERVVVLHKKATLNPQLLAIQNLANC